MSDIITSRTVVAIQGTPVTNVEPSNGQALIYDAIDGYWRPENLPSSLPPSGAAGGDLDGYYPNPNVASISGSNVIATSTNKIKFLEGQNVNISSLQTSNYNIVSGNFVISIGTLTSSITVSLPSSPTTGDVYTIKDVNGTCCASLEPSPGSSAVFSTTDGYVVSIYGNGNNIDNYGSYIYMTIPYSFYQLVYNGSSWSVLNSSSPGLVAPIASNFTGINLVGTYSTATITTGNGINLYSPANASNEDLHCLVQAVPSAPYSIVAGFTFNTWGGAVNNPGEGYIGLCFTNGTTTSSALSLMRVGNFDGGESILGWGWRYYQNVNTFTGGDNDVEYQYYPPFLTGKIYMKIRDDGTNRTFWQSGDGLNFTRIYSESSTNNFTASYAGIVFNPWNCIMNFNCIHYRVINS
jgi:hypothetical protein